MPRRRPHQHAGRDAEGGGERPTDEARTDGGHRLGHGHGKDEGEQGRRGRRGGLRCHDPGEEHREAHHPHRGDGRHLVRRHDGTEHGEAGTDEVEPAVGHEPAAWPPRELHQEEQREGTERSEESDLRVRERHMGDGEHQRHDHGGPDRTLEDKEIGVLRTEPAEETPARRCGCLGFGRKRHGPAGVMVG